VTRLRRAPRWLQWLMRFEDARGFIPCGHEDRDLLFARLAAPNKIWVECSRCPANGWVALDSWFDRRYGDLDFCATKISRRDVPGLHEAGLACSGDLKVKRPGIEPVWEGWVAVAWKTDDGRQFESHEEALRQAAAESA